MDELKQDVEAAKKKIDDAWYWGELTSDEGDYYSAREYEYQLKTLKEKYPRHEKELEALL